jgi:hypothetical protein
MPCCSRFRSRVYNRYGCGPPFSFHFHFTVVCYLKVRSTLIYLNIPFLVYLVLLLVLVPVWRSCCGPRYCIYTFFVLGWSRPALICMLSSSYGVVFGVTPKILVVVAVLCDVPGTVGVGWLCVVPYDVFGSAAIESLNNSGSEHIVTLYISPALHNIILYYRYCKESMGFH